MCRCWMFQTCVQIWVSGPWIKGTDGHLAGERPQILALFCLTAVQMWTDGSFSYSLTVRLKSSLLKHTDTQRKDIKSVRPKGFSPQPETLGWKQSESCMWKCYIHSNSRVNVWMKQVFINPEVEREAHRGAEQTSLSVWSLNIFNS